MVAFGRLSINGYSLETTTVLRVTVVPRWRMQGRLEHPTTSSDWMVSSPASPARRQTLPVYVMISWCVVCMYLY